MFVERLIETIKSSNFNVRQAERLSKDMHAAECEGYKVTSHEDHLWMVLTEKIMEQE